jgi:hypothetical protein
LLQKWVFMTRDIRVRRFYNWLHAGMRTDVKRSASLKRLKTSKRKAADDNMWMFDSQIEINACLFIALFAPAKKKWHNHCQNRYISFTVNGLESQCAPKWVVRAKRFFYLLKFICMWESDLPTPYLRFLCSSAIGTRCCATTAVNFSFSSTTACWLTTWQIFS